MKKFVLASLLASQKDHEKDHEKDRNVPFMSWQKDGQQDTVNGPITTRFVIPRPGFLTREECFQQTEGKCLKKFNTGGIIIDGQNG